MKATINGIKVEGTPDEIAKLMGLAQPQIRVVPQPIIIQPNYPTSPWPHKITYIGSSNPYSTETTGIAI